MDASTILRRAIERLQDEPPILPLSRCKSLAVLGDTHGYVSVTRWFIEQFRNYDCKIMLGDLVDRGSHGVENLELAASMLAEDSGFYIIRGNHESIEMNKYYGFMDEALRKRGREYLNIVEELYRNLPFAALYGEILLVHGGIPCRQCLNRPEEPISIEEIEATLSNVKGTERASLPLDTLAFQLLWNDPSIDIDWFSPSIRGPGAYYYGPRSWVSFMNYNGLFMIIRAHETVDGAIMYTGNGTMIELLKYVRRYLPDGYKEIGINRFRHSVITVFSSLYHGKSAAALAIEGDMLRVVSYPGV